MNVALYGLLAALILFNGRDIRWSAHALSKYLRGSVPVTAEQRLYRHAKRMLDVPELLPEARVLLEKSLAIDPLGEARYALGRVYEASGDTAKAIEAYTRYLDIDPVLPDTYLRLAGLLAKRGDLEAARRVLDRGLRFFRANVELYRPQDVPGVNGKYMKRAVKVYETYRTAIRSLEEAASVLDGARRDSR